MYAGMISVRTFSVWEVLYQIVSIVTVIFLVFLSSFRQLLGSTLKQAVTLPSHLSFMIILPYLI